MNTADMSSRAHPTRELATVLFTDIVDSTEQLAASGDQVWARVLDALDAVTRSEVRRRGGEVVKHTGDGALVLLPSPTTAVECAGALHSGAGQLGVTLRIGAHTGEVERRGLDVAGIAVHVAARLMAAAPPGQTLVSEIVRTLATSPDAVFDDRGDLDLKGIADPVPAFSLRHPEAETPVAPAATNNVDALARLLHELRFEEAAELASDVDPLALVDLLATAGGRIEFLDVDVTLVRMLRDLLDRLPSEETTSRARLEAKLAFELRGDPATLDERRSFLRRAVSLAEEGHDDVAISEVRLATIHALWEPAGAEDRLAAAERVIDLTRRTHHVDHELEARLARFHALIELWRVHEAGLELAAYARLAVRLDRPDVNVFVASRRALLAQISGRYDEQLRQGEIAHRNAVQARMPDAERLRLAHGWAAARDCGTHLEMYAEGIATLRELADLMPGNYYELDLARALLELDRPEDARIELARGLPPLYTSTGVRWLFSMVNAAEVAAVVGSDQDCARLYDLLLPHEDRLVALGPNVVGAVGTYLGQLALRLGWVEEAVRRLRSTAAALDEIAALPWAVRTRLHLARALRAAGESAEAERVSSAASEVARSLGMHRLLAQFDDAARAEGRVWHLSRDGEDWVLEAELERVRLRANRGLEHLATLLANPGRDVPAHQLDIGGEPVPPEDGIPLLDEQALAEYRRRLQDIDAEQLVADRTGDQAASLRLDEEREFLLAEVRRATGLGGRRRSSGGSAERARVNVTRNLKRAIEQIQKAAPITGAHLVASVRTGLHCRYQPAPGGPSDWDVHTEP